MIPKPEWFDSLLLEAGEDEVNPYLLTLLRGFDASHLPPELKEIVEWYQTLALRLTLTLEGPNATVALRKLWESKNAAVFAYITEQGGVVEYAEYEDLVGAFVHTAQVGTFGGEDAVELVTDRGTYLITHRQDCCELVELIDGADEVSTLRGVLRVAEERTTHTGGRDDSMTATFIALRSDRGDCTMRWHGSSNGYYSESVDLLKVRPDDRHKFKGG